MIEVLQYGLSPNRAGIETYLEKIWRYIDHTYFHFNFIVMRNDQPPCFYETFQASDCKFYEITPRRVSPKKNHEDLVNLFQENKFDILHFNLNTASYLLPVAVALRFGCKAIVHSHSSGFSGKKSMSFILHTLNKQRLKKMDVKRIAVSQLAGEWMFGDSHFDVYHNGVITEDFAFSQNNRDSIRHSLNCEGKTVIGSAASFIPAKNHRFMVDVFEEYLRINHDAVLWFAGEGALRSSIEEYVRQKGIYNSVRFLGSRKDMQTVYAGMDMLWLPSLVEGYPNVMLEAQCEGLPCLISDCIPQDTKIMDNTFSLGLNQPIDAWARKIQETVEAQRKNRETCYLDMRNRGTSVEAEIQRIEKLYEEMLAKC